MTVEPDLDWYAHQWNIDDIPIGYLRDVIKLLRYENKKMSDELCDFHERLTHGDA